MALNLSPINAPRLAPVLGAKTVSATDARSAAMAKFNEGMTTAASPAQPGAVLSPMPTEVPPQALEATTPSPAVVVDEVPPPVAVTPPVDSEETLRLKGHYANLARKEKQLRMREMQFKREVEASRAPTTPPAQTFDASKYVDRNELINNPFGVLNTLGLSYEQLTEKALNAPSHEELERRRELDTLKSELKALRDGQEEVKKTFSENQTQARKDAEHQIRQDVNRLVASDTNFEVTHAHGAQNEVVRLITSIYDNGMGPEFPRGTILDAYEAAQMVETELTARALRVAKLKKIQSQLSAPEKPTTTQQQTQPTLRTLTNSVGTSTRPMTPRERALAVFRGESF